MPTKDRTRRTGSARREHGFSLPELLVVLAILGVSTTIGVYVAKTSGWRTAAASGAIARHLELARSRAAFNDHDVRVIFDSGNQTLTVHLDRNSDGDLDTNIGESQTTYHLSSEAAHIVFGCPTGIVGVDGTTVSTVVDLPGDPPVATFRPGGAASPGFLYLIDGKDLERGDPSRMRAISVNEATGRIRRWKYDPDSTGPVPWRLER